MSGKVEVSFVCMHIICIWVYPDNNFQDTKVVCHNCSLSLMVLVTPRFTDSTVNLCVFH